LHDYKFMDNFRYAYATAIANAESAKVIHAPAEFRLKKHKNVYNQ